MTTGKGDEFTARMFDAINAMMWTCRRVLSELSSARSQTAHYSRIGFTEWPQEHPTLTKVRG
jgi:hypothetical protein